MPRLCDVDGQTLNTGHGMDVGLKTDFLREGPGEDAGSNEGDHTISRLVPETHLLGTFWAPQSIEECLAIYAVAADRHWSAFNIGVNDGGGSAVRYMQRHADRHGLHPMGINNGGGTEEAVSVFSPSAMRAGGRIEQMPLTRRHGAFGG